MERKMATLRSRLFVPVPCPQVAHGPPWMGQKETEKGNVGYLCQDPDDGNRRSRLPFVEKSLM
jgi:hypothetical protein